MKTTSSTTIKYNKEKKIERDCKLCMAGFEVWVSNLNFASEREEEMRKKLLDYCPVCKLSKKN